MALINRKRVFSFATLSAFPTVGEVGIVYINLASSDIYLWSGTAYVLPAGGGAINDPAFQFNTYADLPDPTTIDVHVVYVVRRTTGTWGINRKQNGLWQVQNDGGANFYKYLGLVPSTLVKTNVVFNADNRLLKTQGSSDNLVEQTAIEVDDSQNVSGIENINFTGVNGTATDITGEELETLSDTSDASSLHNHESSYPALVNPSIDNEIVRFDGITGQQHGSGVTIDDSFNIDTNTGGYKDFFVTTAIKKGDALNTEYNTINKTDVGSLNEIDSLISNIAEITKETTGFTKPENVILTGDGTARTITLSGSDWEAYHRNTLNETIVDGYTSPVHDNDPTKAYFLNYDGTDISWVDNATLGDNFFSNLLIAIAFYCDDDLTPANSGWRYTRENHELMQWQVHRAEHLSIGAYKRSGGSISGVVLSSTTADERRPRVGETLMFDEDLPTTNALFDSAEITARGYTYLRLSGAGALAQFNFGRTDIVYLSGNQPYWNEFTGGTWTDTLMTNNRFVNVYLIEIPSTSEQDSQDIRRVYLQPQVQYSSQVGAEAEDPRGLEFGVLSQSVPEFVISKRFVIKYIGGNWSIVSYQDIIINRNSLAVSSGSTGLTQVSSDATLSGLGTVDSVLSVVQDYVRLDGTLPLTADWDAGDYNITTESLTIPQASNGFIYTGGYSDNEDVPFDGVFAKGLLFGIRANFLGSSNLYNAVFPSSLSANYGAKLMLTASRGSLGSETILQDGDKIGSFEFAGYDGVDHKLGGILKFEVDGTPGVGDMPTRCVLQLSPDGSDVPADVVSFYNDKSVEFYGKVGIGTPSPSEKLDVANSGDTDCQVLIASNIGGSSGSASANSYSQLYLRISGGFGGETGQAYIRANHVSYSALLGTELSFWTRPSSFGTVQKQMSIDGEGRVLKPYQPRFASRGTAILTNKTGDGTLYTIILDTEDYDIGSNYDTATGIFTAPVDGLYKFDGRVRISGMNSSHNRVYVRLTTSKGNAFGAEMHPYVPRQLAGTDTLTLSVSNSIYLETGNTASLSVTVSGSTKTVSVYATIRDYTSFSGYLVS